jgi:hypothetical protein
VLIPGTQQFVAFLLQMADDIANFMGLKPGIDGGGQVMKPEFGFFLSPSFE